MQFFLWRSRLGRVCLNAAISLFISLNHVGFAAAPPRPDQGPPGPRSEGDRPPPGNWSQFNFPSPQEGGKYWLGVECHEAPPELKSQLGLNDDEGLVVVHLADDGSAAKAGIKRHDIVVSVGDQKLKRVPDLIKAVNASEGKEISLKIIRAGKEQTISVTPAERPQDNARIIARPGPGFMFPGGGPPPELPDNVTVSITWHGKDPAQIEITRGNQVQKISEKELDEKLPEDVRPFIDRMLKPNPFPFPAGLMKDMRIEGMPNDDFHLFSHTSPPGMGPPLHDGRPPHHDGDDGPPHDGNPPPRDGDHGPPDGHRGPGDFGPPPMQPGPIPPELIERLDRLDHQLEMIQDELRHLHDGGPGNMPRMRPHGPDAGPDGPPPRDEPRDGRPPRDDHRDGPPHDGPPHDGPPSHDGPPPNDR